MPITKNSYSILDIAKESGVSKSTVSRVLNKGVASEQAREAVLRTVKKLQYRPCAAAQAMRGYKSRIIGVASLNNNLFSDTSLSQRLAGMNEVFLQEGYSLLLINYNESTAASPLENAFNYLSEKRIDGLICIGTASNENDLINTLRFREVVYTGERICRNKGFRIYLGNYNYSRKIYSHCVQRGHKKILTLVRRKHSESVISRRFDAYADVCVENEIKYSIDDFFDYNDFETKAERQNAIYSAFCSGEYTCIFADTNSIASEAEQFFAEHGLKLREDYSLACVNRGDMNNASAKYTGVVLSDTMYGNECAKLMIDIINCPDMEYRDIVIPYRFEDHDTVIKK